MKITQGLMLSDLIEKLSGRKLIFISHPYANAPEQNFKKVDKVCKYWLRQGYIPISPLHLFSYMEDDRHRKTIMIVCKLLILICGKMAIYGLTEGCKEELEFARKYSIKIFYAYNKDDWDNTSIKSLMEEPKGVKL